ncbi:MAG: DMT family transporter [Betaproteobacteria bacterium]|nr:DMT family transporter [Betaproteobacteria bacterium]
MRRWRSLMTATPAPDRRWVDTALAWYFVSVWGSGFLASKTALLYAPPFTMLTLRYALGVACMVPVLLVTRPAWITALIMALQTLATAVIAWRWMGERLSRTQWAGVVAGLAGVTLVVWHKIDVQELPLGSLVALGFGLTAITAGTLYQKTFCPKTDLKAGAFIQFAASCLALAPMAWFIEGAQIDWAWQFFAALAFLVILASILATNALNILMRHGEATRVTSLIYLTPIIAVALEYPMFGVVPSAMSIAGIVVTCAGVYMVTWRSTRAPSPAAVD